MNKFDNYIQNKLELYEAGVVNPAQNPVKPTQNPVQTNQQPVQQPQQPAQQPVQQNQQPQQQPQQQTQPTTFKNADEVIQALSTALQDQNIGPELQQKLANLIGQ